MIGRGHNPPWDVLKIRLSPNGVPPRFWSEWCLIRVDLLQPFWQQPNLKQTGIKHCCSMVGFVRIAPDAPWQVNWDGRLLRWHEGDCSDVCCALSSQEWEIAGWCFKTEAEVCTDILGCTSRESGSWRACRFHQDLDIGIEYTYYGYYGLVGEVGCIQMQTQGSPFNTVVPYSSISTLYIDLPPKRSKTQQQGCIATPKGSTNLILPLHCEDFLVFSILLCIFLRGCSPPKKCGFSLWHSRWQHPSSHSSPTWRLELAWRCFHFWCWPKRIMLGVNPHVDMEIVWNYNYR